MAVLAVSGTTLQVLNSSNGQQRSEDIAIQSVADITDSGSNADTTSHSVQDTVELATTNAGATNSLLMSASGSTLFNTYNTQGNTTTNNYIYQKNGVYMPTIQPDSGNGSAVGATQGSVVDNILPVAPEPVNSTEASHSTSEEENDSSDSGTSSQESLSNTHQSWLKILQRHPELTEDTTEVGGSINMVA